MTSQYQGKGYLHDIELQLVAEAIAAFHQNHGNRRLAGLPKLSYKRMSGIVMIISSVLFYLIPVTAVIGRHYINSVLPCSRDNCYGSQRFLGRRNWSGSLYRSPIGDE